MLTSHSKQGEKKKAKHGSLSSFTDSFICNLLEPPRTVNRYTLPLGLHWAPAGPSQQHGETPSQPGPARTESGAESSQGPMRPPRGQKERAGFGSVASLLQVSGQLLRIPELGAGQEVLNEVRVEGGGDALHQQLGIQEQRKEFWVTI